MKLALVLWLYTVAGAIVGLDFGQQYSKAVLLSPNHNYQVIETEQGKRKDLSGVCIRPAGGDDISRVYGSQTGSLFTRFPHLCVSDVKQLLGHTIDLDLAIDYQQHHQGLKLVANDARNGAISFDLGLTNALYQFSAEEIAAMTLGTIRDRAVAMLEKENMVPFVDVAVLVLPFALLLTRQLYLDALNIANYTSVLGLVDEGLAVALDYILKQTKLVASGDEQKKWFLVYDLGAGSTTATLFSFVPANATLEVVHIGADHLFGGQHLTNVVADVITEKLLKKFKITTNDITDKMAARIGEAAEKAKLILSANSETRILLELIYDERDFRLSLTREEFEEAVGNDWARVTAPINEALEAAGINASEIELVILNGGSTRVPKVQELIKQISGSISKSVNTDELVLLGTAMRGLQLKTGKSDIILIEHGQTELELSVDGDDRVAVFAPGVVTGTTTDIVLKKAPKKLVELFEDGELAKTIKFDDNMQKKADKVKCEKGEEKQVVAVASYDHNKLFNLDNLEVRCVPPLVEEVEDDEVDIEDKPQKQTKQPKKPTQLVIPKVHHYPSFRPLSVFDQIEIVEKLRYLKHKDNQKIELEETRNQLEALCYQLREGANENEQALLKTIEADELAEHLQLVSDTLEWLEFEEAQLDEVKERLEKVEKTHNYLDISFKVSQVDLSYKAMKKMYKDGNTVYTKLSERLEYLEGELEKFKEMYEAEGFDWEKEKTRLLKGALAELLKNVRKITSKFKVDLEELKLQLDKTSAKEFEEKLKHDIYKIHNKIAQHMMDLLTDLMTIETSVQDKVKDFDSKLGSLIKRRDAAEKKAAQKKKKQEERAKKAAEEEAKKAEETNDDEVTDEKVDTEVDIDEPVESPQSTQSTQADNDLEDEL